jgi:hypothetical protein
LYLFNRVGGFEATDAVIKQTPGGQGLRVKQRFGCQPLLWWREKRVATGDREPDSAGNRIRTYPTPITVTKVVFEQLQKSIDPENRASPNASTVGTVKAKIQVAEQVKFVKKYPKLIWLSRALHRRRTSCTRNPMPTPASMQSAKI